MWRSKKLIFIEVLIGVALLATVGMAAVAHANDENTAQNSTTNLMEKVAEIYQANTGAVIDPQELEKAFRQALQEMRTMALDEFLQKLVEEGKITQEQADEFKAWLQAKPDIFTEELKEWLESRPDIPGLFGQNGGGFMPFGGVHHGRTGIGEGFGLRSHDCWSD